MRGCSRISPIRFAELLTERPRQGSRVRPGPIRGLGGDFSIPVDVLAEANAHRALLGAVVQVRPRHVWHGHLHHLHDGRIDLGWREDRPDWDGEAQVHGLDSDQGRWQANLALVGPDGARLPWPDDGLVTGRL